MRFTFLLMAVSAIVIAMLAWVSQMGGESKTPTASPSNSSTESQKTGAPMSGLTAIFERKTKTASTLAERLAENPHAALEWLLQTSGRGQSSAFSTDVHLQSAVIEAANRLMRTTRSELGQGNPVTFGKLRATMVSRRFAVSLPLGLPNPRRSGTQRFDGPGRLCGGPNRTRRSCISGGGRAAARSHPGRSHHDGFASMGSSGSGLRRSVGKSFPRRPIP
jgi:hypothetical protein